MRVAHIITRMSIGGAQENTFYNCRDLVRDFGDEVLLITGPAEGPEGALLEQVRGEFTVQIVPELIRSISPWHDWRAYASLKRILREFRPDVVHTHSAKGGMLGRTAAWAVGVPAIVHTVHGAPFGDYEPWLRRRFYQACERFAAKRCHALISVAEAMTDLMVAARVAPREKFTTAFSGMEIEPFLNADCHREAMRRRLGFASSDVVVGKIARLFPLKGHDDFLAAASVAARSTPNLKFLLVGDGILRERLEAKAAAAGLTERVTFAGLVPPAEVPAYLGAMDLLVHTSLREGLARALPQALLAGKPVIAYDVDGAREVVLPDLTGILLPAGDIAGLTAAMRRLAEDADLRAGLGAEGRRRFEDQFRHERMTAEIRRLYLRLLGDSRTSRS